MLQNLLASKPAVVTICLLCLDLPVHLDLRLVELAILGLVVVSRLADPAETEDLDLVDKTASLLAFLAELVDPKGLPHHHPLQGLLGNLPERVWAAAILQVWDGAMHLAH